MAEADLAWMPMYWGDYLKDTAHLNAAEHGAYLMLIAHYWVTREPLPTDDERLRRIARMERGEWKRSCDVVLGFFTETDVGWTHKRIGLELASSAAKRASAKQKASIAATAKWAKAKQIASNAPSNAPSIHQALLEQCPSPSPSEIYPPSQEAKASFEPPPLKIAREANGSRLPDDWKPQDEAISWAERHCPNVDLVEETERFCDYWQAKPGKDGRKTDWTATWRNWIRKAQRPLHGKPTPPSLDGDGPPWHLRVADWNRDGTWFSFWGPAPNQSGFQGPPSLAVKPNGAHS